MPLSSFDTVPVFILVFLSISFTSAYDWERTICGSPSNSKGDIDIITEWGEKVTAENTVDLFGYPRPQMARDSYRSLNGIWEFQEVDASVPKFNQNLAEKILVPFPVESCLSGLKDSNLTMNYSPTYQNVWYRKTVDINLPADERLLIHFGAVDWRCDVYVNSLWVGTHTGGYSGFSFDISNYVNDGENEIFLVVDDPANHGPQPFGKQVIERRMQPGGDIYGPITGIWQTVWLETVPKHYITNLKINADLTSLHLTVDTNLAKAVSLLVEVTFNGKIVVRGKGFTGESFSTSIPKPKLWSPEEPNLYNMTISIPGDSVRSYFGMRVVSLGKDKSGTTRPLINGKYRFLAGFLDQSWWPDGLYTAPGDEALYFDLYATKHLYGFNTIRLHQKVNPQLWYYYADVLGIVVLQDAVQHYGDAHGKAEARYYFHDLKAMIDDVGNHPSIIQWETFNEGDMVHHFDGASVVRWTKKYDSTRLVDTNSGGPANDLHVGDVNDIHRYPGPGDTKPSDSQYAMIGEFGGLGAFIEGHVWTHEGCYAYRAEDSVETFAQTYIDMTRNITGEPELSSSIYTQTTDVENECDGFLNFDRTNKFSEDQNFRVRDANKALIGSPVACGKTLD